MQAETLYEYADVVTADGHAYVARACGRGREDGLWEGWLEFTNDAGEVVRTPRETTQPNRTDLAYWATGVTGVYLEGALRRALDPAPAVVASEPPPPVFDGPAERVAPVLDPYDVYRRGESALRGQLGALAAWHLRAIARAYVIALSPSALEGMSKQELIETIVASVRAADRRARGAVR